MKTNLENGEWIRPPTRKHQTHTNQPTAHGDKDNHETKHQSIEISGGDPNSIGTTQTDPREIPQSRTRETENNDRSNCN
ncbi:hypothetical protein A2U01_0086894, partial [Trifolium medium]|nr:hypothetical protein [Trifolium medium]